MREFRAVSCTRSTIARICDKFEAERTVQMFKINFRKIANISKPAETLIVENIVETLVENVVET